MTQGKQTAFLVTRRVVKRLFAWVAGFRSLARAYERLTATVAGLHLVAFAALMLHQFISSSCSVL